MGQAYAGVLGLLACGLTLVRGLAAGAAPESTIAAACGSLFAFAAVGWIAGRLAERFTEESVRSRFQQALHSLEPDKKKMKPTTAT